MRTKPVFTVLFVLGLFATFAGVASAHHSVAGMDNKTELQLKGTVTQFVWRNPHVLVFWNVKDASGKVTEWSGEMNSPTSMIQVGMNRQSLKIGDEVIVSLHPSKTGAPISTIIKVTKADGSIVVDRITPQ